MTIKKCVQVWLTALSLCVLLLFAFIVNTQTTLAQSINAGTIEGVVADPNDAVVPNATVTIENAVTGYAKTVTTDAEGKFQFLNIPPNNYRLSVTANGFNTSQQNITVRTSVPISLKVSLVISDLNAASVDVSQSESEVIENVPSTQIDVGQALFSKLPTTPGSGLSNAVTLAAPGVVADSNGFFHPLGDHAQTTIALDNQPISDQQSKAFSTQIPTNAIQSMEVITGATPAEFGDKTSLVVNATTRSGLGLKKPEGDFNTGYGSFGSINTDASLAFGNSKSGNFTAFNIERSGRFLDAPEFTVLHDKGTSGSIFNRFDYNLTPNDAFHFNLFLARNKFEIPNTFDQQALNQDQRQLVRSINIAPGYVRIFSPTTVLSVNPYFRRDLVKYYPSSNPFSDETQTISQQRHLTNTGIRADLSYNKGINNAKFGVQFSHTFLTEAFQFGITDPNFNDPLSPNFIPSLLRFDLTRGGHLFTFNGHTDIKQEAFYAQDTINLKQLTLSLGLRFDNYNGISKGNALQPRVGASYQFKRTNTVLRASYTRNFETPYNENLVLSSSTGAGGLADGILGSAISNPLKPGTRNQFNIGFQQSIGRLILIDVDYVNKRTNNAYDFAALLNTPITFPISWDKSKIDGISARINLTNYKGFTAFTTLGHSRARFFPPGSGGLFFNSDLPTSVFRIDHDQKFQQTTQVQYQFSQLKKIAPYMTFTWRYDSGVVAGSVPDYATALTLTADQQAQIGLFCGNVFATLTNPITNCTNANRGALRLRIPAEGTANDDTNPPRIAPRHLFDFGLGTDNLFKTERAKVTLRFTVINLTNKIALYNFLSTFSGTHFVSPRTFQGQIGIKF